MLQILGVETIFPLVSLDEELPAGMLPMLGPPGTSPSGPAGTGSGRGIAQVPFHIVNNSIKALFHGASAIVLRREPILDDAESMLVRHKANLSLRFGDNSNFLISKAKDFEFFGLV